MTVPCTAFMRHNRIPVQITASVAAETTGVKTVDQRKNLPVPQLMLAKLCELGDESWRR